MKKVLITGAKGMLGQDAVKAFREEFSIFPFSHRELDITDLDQLRGKFREIMPDIVLNCAAYTKVDQCETERDMAFLVNGTGPLNLSIACKEVGAMLIHISTDYVFDGNFSFPIKEEERPSPINAYGESKLLGEKNIMENMNDFLIVRTSWLFGENGPNFIKTILGLSKERDSLSVVNDQRGSPTFTRDLAMGIRLLFEKGAKGIVNCTNTGACTWYELARFSCDFLKRQVRIEPIKSEEFRRPAKRPKYSVLSSKRFREITGKPMRHWQDAVSEYLETTFHGK